MEPEGIVIVDSGGTERLYPTGRTFETDGFGDVIIKDSAGNMIAMEKRSDVRRTYVRYPD